MQFKISPNLNLEGVFSNKSIWYQNRDGLSIQAFDH